MNNINPKKDISKKVQLQRIKEETKNRKIEVTDDGHLDQHNRKIGVKEVTLKKPGKGQERIRLSYSQKMMLRKKPEHTFLVYMLFSNGTSKLFVINTNKTTFILKKKMYYLFYEEACFDLTMNQFVLFYHERFSTPINREIREEGNEAFFSVKPEVMENLIAMRYVDAIVGGNIKPINWWLIGGVAVGAILLFSMLKSQGG